MLVNNAEIISRLNIAGINTGKDGRKLVPEVLNRETVYEMMFKGREIAEEQMFRRIKTISPTHNVTFVGLKNAAV
jgi:hypothetical protein